MKSITLPKPEPTREPVETELPVEVLPCGCVTPERWYCRRALRLFARKERARLFATGSGDYAPYDVALDAFRAHFTRGERAA